MATFSEYQYRVETIRMAESLFKTGGIYEVAPLRQAHEHLLKADGLQALDCLQDYLGNLHCKGYARSIQDRWMPTVEKIKKQLTALEKCKVRSQLCALKSSNIAGTGHALGMLAEAIGILPVEISVASARDGSWTLAVKV